MSDNLTDPEMIAAERIRDQNGKWVATTAHEILLEVTFRLGFADQRQGLFRDEWDVMKVTAALGPMAIHPKLGHPSKWGYERGQSFAAACPDVSCEHLGEVTAEMPSHPLVRRLTACFQAGEVM